MWVDNDVPNWLPILNNFYRSPIHQSQTYLPFAIKNVTAEWYINHKPTYLLLSRTRLVSDISITNLSTICYQKRDWWVIYSYWYI
jgi:hypothetical protein